MRKITARDGRVAYELPGWTREKLDYIERYMDAFVNAMDGKWTLVYADLLAGPGLCVDRVTKEELPGSALLAANRPEFDRLFLNDLDTRVTSALKARTASHSPHRVRISTGNCNNVIEEARTFLFPFGASRSTLGLAVIDPQAYQMRSDSIARLTDSVRMDLMIVFMTSFAKRFILQPSFESPLTGLIGNDAVQRLVHTVRFGGKITTADLLDAFEARLNSIGYPYVFTPTRTENSVRQTMYHVVFASKHHLGRDIFASVAQRRWNGQKRLALF